MQSVVAAGAGEERPAAFESPIHAYLSTLQADVGDLTAGTVATYIPELARADPEKFGIAIATVDGPGYDVGDAGVSFTIQSISKPFVFGLALEDYGHEELPARVGVEPSGDAFLFGYCAPTMSRMVAVIAAIALVALVGCSDWDNPAQRVAREMQRIGYGCQDFQIASVKALAPRGITAAGSCNAHGRLLTISVYKNGAALRADRAALDARCRRLPQPDRGFQALPYVHTGRSVIEGVFLSAYDQPPDVVRAFWLPVANEVASATHGRIEDPSC